MTGASGRVVLILTAGLLICCGTPLQAATSGTEESAQSDSASKPVEVKKNARHKRHSADRQSGKTASEKSSSDSSDKKDASNATDGNVTPASSAMPPSVANAKAQVAAADTPAAAATAMTARANDNVQAAADGPQAQPAGDGQVVASDQLNDLDRALQENSPAAPAAATPAAQPRPVSMMAAASSESSTWDQTSLIGKIFIGFGTLLTLASAARMFMA
jgi:cytoskeletal protein RodZ